MGSGDGRAAAPRATGSVIGVIFGFMFVEANAAGLHGGLQTAVRAGGVIVALALLAAVNRARKAVAPVARRQAAPRPADGRQFGPRYWVIVAAEVAALVAGLVVINVVARAHELTVPWIAVVVGVHFFGLAALWKVRVFAVLGVVVALLGAAGFALHAAGASALTVRVVSGIGSGVALYLAVANSLVRPIGSGAGRQAVGR